MPASLEIVAGNQQTGVVGRELSNPLVARVTDASGQPVAGYLVNFRVTKGGGSLFAGSAISNSEGEVRERWTLGTATADSQQVEARAVDATTGAAIVFATFTAIPLPDAATLIAVSQTPQLSNTGATNRISVSVTDQYRNPVPNVSVNWAIELGGGSLSATQSATDSTGIAATQWTFGTVPQPSRVTASISAGSAPKASFDVDVRALAQKIVVLRGARYLTGAGFSAPAGSSISDTIRIRVTDNFDNPVPSAPVSWQTGGGGVVQVCQQLGVCASSDVSSVAVESTDTQGTMFVPIWKLGLQSADQQLVADAGSSVRITFAVTATFVAWTTVSDGDGQHICGVADGRTLCYWWAVGAAAPPASGSGSFWAQVSASPLQSLVSTSISACGVDASNVLYCAPWGGVLGQIASGIVTVTGGDNGVRCAVSLAGSGDCWGLNGTGALGDGTTTSRTSPTPVLGGLAFTQIAAGGQTSCGVAVDGTAYCWGRNESGQLGIVVSDTLPHLTPVAVSGGFQFSSITGGSTWFDPGVEQFEGTHVCGLTTAGAAYCWGSNSGGQLGNGSTISSSTPVAVSGGLTFKTITSFGGHTCGIDVTDQVYCWGDNTYGEAGAPIGTNTSLPTRVTLSAKVRMVATGQSHTCAVLVTGRLYCWGWNARGFGFVGQAPEP